jgi:hypothetical protein
MVRLISALILVLLIATPTLGQSVVGTYKLISLVPDVDGKPSQPMGKAPHGFLVLTPTHFITVVTAENRKFGTSVDAKAALLDSLIAYAGVYRLEGDNMHLTIEVAWTENVVGNTSVETFQLSGNRLTKTLGPTPWPRDPSKTMIRREVWEKIE